jgi:predicted metal-dependent hydrolase
MRSLLQLTLDFFSTDPVPAPALVPQARPDPEPADEPTLSLDQALDVGSYRHPQANRQAMLGGVHVAYAFGRGRRRTIGFSVGAEGLSVRAPRWVPLREIDSAVQEKADWILRKLQETRQRHVQIESKRIVWSDGARLALLGQPLTVRLDPAHRYAKGEQLQGEPGDQCLWLALPNGASPEQIRDAAQAWLMRRARSWFEERLNHYAAQLGVRWSRLALSSAATRWGSASADGSIRLHWRLIHFRPEVIDYVVVHELSHLRVMDHSPRFWAMVGSVVPNYAQLRAQLRDQPMARW